MNLSLDNELLKGIMLSLYIQILILGILNLIFSKLKFRQVILGMFCFLIGAVMFYNLFWNSFTNSFIANFLFAGFKHLYFAPLLYLYVITIVDFEEKYKKLIRHIFFPTLVTVFYLIFKFGFSNLFQEYFKYIAPILMIVTCLYYLSYILLFLKNKHKLKALVPSIKNKYGIFYFVFLSYLAITSLISFVSVFILNLPEAFFEGLNNYFNFPLSFIAYFLIIVFTISENNSLKSFFVAKSPFLDKDLVDNKSEIEYLIQERIIQEKRFKDVNLKLNDVAKEFNITTNAISEYIRFYHKKSFNEFINDLRIEEFKNVSTSTDISKLSISGIAFECGFKSKATFYRLFKEKESISPGEYLKKM